MNRAGIFLLLFLTTAVNRVLADVEVRLHPKLCTIKDSDRTCSITLKVSSLDSQTSSQKYCIHLIQPKDIEAGESAINGYKSSCFRIKPGNFVTVALEIDQSSNVLLYDEAQTLIFNQTIKIMKESRFSNRRHAWSLF